MHRSHPMRSDITKRIADSAKTPRQRGPVRNFLIRPNRSGFKQKPKHAAALAPPAQLRCRWLESSGNRHVSHPDKARKARVCKARRR